MPRIVLTLLAVLLAGGCSNTSEIEPLIPTYPKITIERDSAPPLVIENDGSPNSQKLFFMANEVIALDEEIEQWRQRTQGDPAVLQLMVDTISQNRADAAAQLESAWQAANSRSWASLSEHIESADKNIQSARGAIDSDVPDSAYCRTQISAASEGSYMHYMPEGAFRAGGEDWTSYTPGSKIKIGNYRFRVSGNDQVFNEKITILQDPFIHVIQPL
ncbi:hypothetical protein [Microbulbifer sp. M83]|uniref:hypothetical protein n=1 Tax=unclassified Microbulbifer TaxID=2619833 RepID=UPI002FDFCE5B